MAGQQPTSLKCHPRKNVVFADHQKMEPPNSAVPKVAATGQPIQVLHAVRTGVSAEAKRGRATVPPPKSCGNNASDCSDRGVALGGEGGAIEISQERIQVRFCGEVSLAAEHEGCFFRVCLGFAEPCCQHGSRPKTRSEQECSLDTPFGTQ